MASVDLVVVDAAVADPVAEAAEEAEKALLKKLKKQNPQKTIDDFWARFTIKTPGQAFTVLPDNLHAKQAARYSPEGVIPAHATAASFEEAAATCKAKVEKIVKENRRVNQKYRDPHFDLDIDLKLYTHDCLNGLLGEGLVGTPAAVKRVGDIFESPKFFIDGASAEDVKQGRDGDCWFLAALCTLSNKESLISRICVARDEDVGVYGFVFNRDGEWISTIIDDKLYLIKPDYDEVSFARMDWDQHDKLDAEQKYRKTLQTGSEALFFAQCSNQNETWLPLLEKAYAKAHGDFSSIEGGFVGEAIEDLTGGVTKEIFTTDILDREKFWREEIMHVNKDFLFGCFTGLFGGWGERKGIIEGHAYSIMKAVEVDDKKLVLLKNPWGKSEWTGPWSDGSKEWTPYWMERLQHRFGDDGAFWISYEDLLSKYQHLDRTRLFRTEDNWAVTQQWTSLLVPWSVDYQDTKFSVELSEKGPIVIVLSQLDSRYFRGLEGQYECTLHFRLHKEGEEDYIVRSHGGYLMTRSVSTEIELEPGRYSVLVKVVATRDKRKSTPEEVIRKTCREKRSKLLQIGLSYDLAHAKGQVKETEKEKKKREKKEAKEKRKEEKKKLQEVKAREKARKLKLKLKETAKAKKAKMDRRNQKQANRLKENTEDERAAMQAKAVEGTKSTETGKSKPDVGEPFSKDHKPSTDGEQAKPGQKKPAAESKNLLAARAVPILSDAAAPTTQHTDSPPNTVAATGPPLAAATTGNAPIHDMVQTTITTVVGSPDDGSDSSDDDSDDHGTDGSDSDSDTTGPAATSTTVTTTTATTAEADATAAVASGDEDAFEADPWNASVIVGLRVYSKDKKISVEVVRPTKKSEEGLDIDDSAIDATKLASENKEPAVRTP